MVDRLLIEIQPLGGISLHPVPIAALEACACSPRNRFEAVLKCTARGVNRVSTQVGESAVGETLRHLYSPIEADNRTPYHGAYCLRRMDRSAVAMGSYTDIL